MSDEIEVKNEVANFTYYDSDEDEEDENFEDVQLRDDLEEVDEQTEELGEKISELIKDVASIDSIGKKVFRIDFYDSSGDFEFSQGKQADFDLNESGYPYLPDGGEEFIIIFLKTLQKNHFKKLKGCEFETNVKGFSFKI